MTKKSKIAASLLPLVCAVAIAACGQTGSPGGIAAMLPHQQALAADCHGPDNVYVGDDGSTSGRSDPTLTEDRIGLIHAAADQAAACGGRMKVVLFGKSEAETSTLGEAEFPTTSGTETARLIAAHKIEEALLAETEETLPTALKEVDPAGTDVLSQFELARQFSEQVPVGHLEIFLATDGIQTRPPVVMNTPGFTKLAAHKAAEQVALPDLSGADVQIAGVGQASGTRRPSTEKVEAMTTFYEGACARSGASKCLVTTDYTRRGAEVHARIHAKDQRQRSPSRGGRL